MALKKRLAEQVFGDDLFPHHQGPPCADFFDGCAAHPGLCDNMSQRTGGGYRVNAASIPFVKKLGGLKSAG